MVEYHEGVFSEISDKEFRSDLKVLLLRFGQVRRKRGNCGTKKHKVAYRNNLCSFDIETSRIRYKEEDHAIMYVWQFAIDDYVFIGRTWDEYKYLVSIVDEVLADREYLVVYVHNLSYEFQFLSGIFTFENENVFCIKSRRILKASHGHIEYRCSMLHSNMSLAKWTQNLNAEHKKLSGDDFDYNAVRYPHTPLTDEQLLYCVYDVLGVTDCIRIELERDDDNLYSIPLTSTGYVRRNVKRAMNPIAWYVVRDLLYLKLDVYEMLQRAFRGGDTHANRYFVNRKLENVKSYDRSSSYPDVLLNHKFPTTQFVQDITITTLDEMMEDIMIKERACLADIAIYNYSQADRYNGFPYLSFSKCRRVSKDLVLDNGRILSASYFETTVTDIDLRIIVKEMSPDTVIKPLKYYHARYGKLPELLLNEIRKYYKDKTKLKGTGDDYFYMKSKNLLNSIYGLMVQNPCKPEILFDECGYHESTEKSMQDLLNQYNKVAFTSYQWGIFVTAAARYELRRGLWNVGRFAVYCDTDSIKFIGDADFSEMNREYMQSSIENNAFAVDPKGKTHYMGVYEYEGTYNTFATLGAKKYCYEDDNGLHITIAGVNKTKGAKELAAAGGIDRFLLDTVSNIGTNETELDTNGFIFKEGGGNELIYNDDKTYGNLTLEGNTYEITRNVVIKPSTYQIGITADYKRLLSDYVYIYEDVV